MVDLRNRTTEQILKGFVDIGKSGTSKDCRIYVEEAKHKGITYAELCEYKKKTESEK